MGVVSLDRINGKTAKEVAFDIIRSAISYKAETYTLHDGKLIVAVCDTSLTVRDVGEKKEINGVKVVAYKMGESVYEFDVDDGRESVSVVLINPDRVIQLSRSPTTLKFELDNNWGVTLPPSVEVVEKYRSHIDDIPVIYYGLEGDGNHGVARFNEKSGIITFEIWRDDGNVVTLVAF